MVNFVFIMIPISMDLIQNPAEKERFPITFNKQKSYDFPITLDKKNAKRIP